MDAELERFKCEIDLRQYAAHQGYELDRKESWGSSAVMRNATHDKVIIKRSAADRHWIYCSVRNDEDNGTIIDFVKYRLGLSLGAVRKELRQFMGLPASTLPHYTPLPKVTKDRLRVERAYARAKALSSTVHHPYLENERCIPHAVLTGRRFVGRLRIDARGNALFPHFDVAGLAGFEVKNCGFTGYSTGGSKALWMSHIEDNDDRIVFSESAIDCLSFAALFPYEHGRYASIGGRPSPKQRELIRSAAAILPPSSTVVAAMDADAAGRDLAEIVREAVGLAGRTDLQFELQEPQAGKDWNDVLRRLTQVQRARPVDTPSVG